MGSNNYPALVDKIQFTQVKNKEGFTIYAEAIYPGEFRTRHCRMGQFVVESVNGPIYVGSMPAIVTGWVQNHVHIQFSCQSLQ